MFGRLGASAARLIAGVASVTTAPTRQAVPSPRPSFETTVRIERCCTVAMVIPLLIVAK